MIFFVSQVKKIFHSNKINEINKNNRRDGRVVEGARLESVCTVKGIKGSNPFLSATKIFLIFIYNIFCNKYVLFDSPL